MGEILLGIGCLLNIAVFFFIMIGCSGGIYNEEIHNKYTIILLILFVIGTTLGGIGLLM